MVPSYGESKLALISSVRQIDVQGRRIDGMLTLRLGRSGGSGGGTALLGGLPAGMERGLHLSSIGIVVRSSATQDRYVQINLGPQRSLDMQTMLTKNDFNQEA